MALKFTEIRIDRTKSLGNYENIKLGFSVTVDESENPVEAIDRLKLILDFQLNKEERELQYARFKKQLESGEANGKTSSMLDWMQKYETQLWEVSLLS